MSGIQRYIRWNGNPSIDVFKDGEFTDFRMCLDSQMKRLQKAGVSARVLPGIALALAAEILSSVFGAAKQRIGLLELCVHELRHGRLASCSRNWSPLYH